MSVAFTPLLDDFNITFLYVLVAFCPDCGKKGVLGPAGSWLMTAHLPEGVLEFMQDLQNTTELKQLVELLPLE